MSCVAIATPKNSSNTTGFISPIFVEVPVQLSQINLSKDSEYFQTMDLWYGLGYHKQTKVTLSLLGGTICLFPILFMFYLFDDVPAINATNTNQR